MYLKVFIKKLEENEEEFEYKKGEHNGVPGIFVKNKHFDTETHFTKDAIKCNGWITLITATHHSKNVEQMTRVTGYFSKTSGWNKGKLGELKERDRVKI